MLLIERTRIFADVMTRDRKMQLTQDITEEDNKKYSCMISEEMLP